MNAVSEHPPLFAPERVYEIPIPPRKPTFMTAIAKVANENTPASVEVPATLPGITQWVLGQWGPWGVILLMACAFLWLYVGSVQEKEKILLDRIVEQQKEMDLVHRENQSYQVMIQTMDRAMKAAHP